MSLLLAISIIVRVTALAWSVVLMRRGRDWRLLFLTVMLLMMTARQVLTLIDTASAAEGGDLPAGAMSEMPALIVSVMALFAVIAIDGVLLRSTRATPDRSVNTAAPRTLAPVAIGIGAIAVIGCITVGLLAFSESRERSMQEIAANNLTVARAIGQHINRRVEESAVPAETQADTIARIERIWNEVDRAYEGSYLCVVDSRGDLVLHTARPDMVGADVHNAAIGSADPRDPATVGELLASQRDWFGRNVNLAGVSQLIGYAYSKPLNGLVAVHTPSQLVENDIQAAALPWLLALALLAGVLIPIAIGLLHRSFAAAQRSLLATTTELRDREARLRLQAQLLSSVHESVVAVDLDGKVIYWGSGAETLYGSSAADVMGKRLSLVIPTLDEAADDERMQQVRETGSWCGQYIRQRTDGTSFWVDSFAALVRDENGGPSGYISIDRDITNRKFVQESLQHTTSQLAIMLDSMPVITYTRRASGDYGLMFVSRNAEEITGYPVDSFTSDSAFWINRVHRDDLPEVRDHLSRIPETNEVHHEYRWQVADGTYRWFHDALRLNRGADGEPSHLVGVLQDVTERKQSEESLRESERQFRQLTENIRGVFWLFDCEEDRILYASPAYESVWGRPIEDLYESSTRWLETIHSDDRERMNRLNMQQFEFDGFDEEYRIITGDGKTRWIHDRSFPISDEHGSVRRIAGIAEDITEQKEAHEEMKQLQIALENAMRGISRLDANGCFVEVRDAYAEMLGYTPDQMIGMNWEPTVHPDDRAIATAAYERMLEHGRSDAEVRAVRRDGTEFMKHVLLVKATDESGRASGHYCFMQDVSERKDAAARLLESEGRFRAVFESEPECVKLLDPLGSIIDINPAGLSMIEAGSLEQVVGECVHPIITPEYREEFIEATRAVFNGETRMLTFEIVGLRGRHRWMESHMVPLRSANGEACALLAVTRDITDRRRADEEQRRTNELERLLFRELDHRVRNNLSSLVTLIDITGANARDTRSFADAIRGRVQAMATSHGLLTRSKWRSSSLRDLVHSLVPSSAQGALDFSGDDVLVPAHQTSSLGMVLHELFTNSIKYGALGSEGARISLSCRVEHDLETSEKVSMHWKESGGPIVEVKPMPGVGTSLIEGLVRNDLRGEVALHYDSAGVDHRITMVLARDDSVEPNRPRTRSPRPGGNDPAGREDPDSLDGPHDHELDALAPADLTPDA